MFRTFQLLVCRRRPKWASRASWAIVGLFALLFRFRPCGVPIIIDFICFSPGGLPTPNPPASGVLNAKWAVLDWGYLYLGELG